ncbi:MAG: HAMP domain-containing histidine kinase, partial [Bacteroidales bacterium]|nr:HAMP domain-containing histidine kinase [Bacteroidales bacterium]
ASDDPHFTDLAKALRESIDSLCELLDDLLSWSRSKLGALQYEPMYIDIESLVEEAKQIVKPLCTAKNIAIKVSIKERDKLYGDQNMIKTILRNLLTNAIKYSYRDSFILLEFDAEGFYSVIRVTDNGIGMNKKELNEIFQLDKIVSKPGTNLEAGNGLGLIVCKEFVSKHDGTISVDAEENLGTSITVKIPYMRYMNMLKGNNKSGK